MKIFFFIFCFLILFFCLIASAKQDLCNEDQIIISNSEKCEKIIDILEFQNLTLEDDNLLYLALNNNGKIEKNGYKLEIFALNDIKLQSQNITESKLYISNSCLEKMEVHPEIKLERNKGIVIIVNNYNNINKNNISDNYFIIRHNSPNAQIRYINSKEYDFSFCHENPILLDNEINVKYLRYDYGDNKPIDLDKILYGKKYGIDLFDPFSDFLNDICFKFTSENGSDVTLESRFEDYYQNITFCDDNENSHYISYNYSEEKNTITYKCAFGYYKSVEDKSSSLDIVDKKINSLFSVSTIKVITCYKKAFNLKDLIKNYGGIVSILVLIIQIVCFLIFLFLRGKTLKDKIDNALMIGKVILARLNITSNKPSFPNELNDGKKRFNFWGEGLRLLKRKKTEKHKTSVNSPPKKGRKKRKSKQNLKENKDEIKKDNVNNDDIKIVGNQNNEEKASKKSDSSGYYDFNNDELMELPFEKAIKFDKRSFCKYYKDMISISHIILFIFFNNADYNLLSVKISFFFISFPINLTFNIFFYTNKTIKLSYILSKEGIPIFLKNLSNTIYSSILSHILIFILNHICLTHDSIRTIMKMNEINKAFEKWACTLRCIKIRITIYYALSFLLLLFFGFYVICFCWVFENIQIEIIKSTFTTWAISLTYPFIFCFIVAVIRILAFKKKSKCLYKFKKILEFLIII